MYMGAGATTIRDTHADGLFERAELYLKRYAAEHRHYLHHQWEDEKERKSKVGNALREIYFIPTKPDDVHHRSLRLLETKRKFELKHGNARGRGVRAEPCSWSVCVVNWQLVVDWQRRALTLKQRSWGSSAHYWHRIPVHELSRAALLTECDGFTSIRWAEIECHKKEQRASDTLAQSHEGGFEVSVNRCDKDSDSDATPVRVQGLPMPRNLKSSSGGVTWY